MCKAGYLPPVFGKIVRTGRHRGIDLLWTAQRASEVSRTLTSATDLWILYSQTEPRDLDAIAERCGREIADKVAGLGLHDSFIWDVIEREIMADSPRLLKREVPGGLLQPAPIRGVPWPDLMLCHGCQKWYTQKPARR